MLVIYLLFLEKEKMYRFNRFYLVLSIVFSFLVPFIVIEGYSWASQELYGTGATTVDPLVTGHAVIEEQALSTETIVFIIYGLIASALVLRLIRNVYLILSRASKNKRIPFHSAELVLLKNNAVSHNFWNYIFINEEEYANQGIEKEVFAHELAHARQKHTLDILFIELLQAIFWFNPVLIIYRRAIQMNHEFLADEAVVLAYNNPRNYQLLLLDKISGNSRISLGNSLNYRITKKRLIMLALKPANRKTVLLKELAIIPAMLLAVFLFSAKVIAGDQAPAKAPLVDIDIPVSIEIIIPPG
ncbi:MAG: M56 family metallopeptidase [Chitinophagaceae bacterium]|nr:M56 family metallopeptidase [Chitinophagaceae bacterium]MCW5925393.1 M56 family metallopeptidase [Chitinophagaceae bacterium]